MLPVIALMTFGTFCSGETETIPAKTTAFIGKAREQIGVTIRYDGSYQAIPYPMGDVPKETGVCTDVVIRAMRGVGLDLQQAVHEDMKSHFSQYPKIWGLKGPDRNIDHRRVPNLMKFFERKGWKKPVSDKPEDFLPGDLVCWLLGGTLPHIGIVSDKKTESGTPLIIHNIGGGAQEEDCLFNFKMTGHYRPVFR